MRNMELFGMVVENAVKCYVKRLFVKVCIALIKYYEPKQLRERLFLFACLDHSPS